MTDQTDGSIKNFEPPYPALLALVACTAWIFILSLPMWTGQFLAGPASDQYATGYAWRFWQAETWKALGHFPLWNPHIFGGLPYVGAFHGDIFYPTAWLRLVLPTALAMNLGFVVHYVLAGFFCYLLLRRLKVTWGGSIVGGLAYQLSGVIGTYVQPGHDGKLFVTALLPLVLLSLVMAVRERRYEGYGLLALAMGLAMLSPHPQLTQYMMIAAGIFTLYLAFGEPSERSLQGRIVAVSLALGAIVLGFGIGAIQLLPSYDYIPFSPRAESYRGFEEATSYAIPWNHVPEFFLSGFAGQSVDGTYWGSNWIKLHSEYLGLPVLALAVLGVFGKRRRLVWWMGGIGLLFLLVTLGSSTPFYRLWYAVVPLVKQTRAPGMALFIVALVVSIFAAFGVERLERGEGKAHAKAWLFGGGAVVLLALLGAFGGLAFFLAQGIQHPSGQAVADVAAAAASEIRWGAAGSGLALLLIGVLAFFALREKLKPMALCLGLATIVSGDLWLNCNEFWVFSRAHETLHSGDDPIVQYLTAQTPPFRVRQANVYRASSLQKHNLSMLLGHHGNELHRYDELLGGKDRWEAPWWLTVWDLYAVRYVIVPTGAVEGGVIPGYTRVMSAQQTSAGVAADLYERATPVKYGRLVPAAITATDEQVIPTLATAGFPPDQLILLAPEADVDLPQLTDLPPALDNQVVFQRWEPGRMSVSIEPPAERDAFLLISENWYPDWTASVDGVAAQVFRGNMSQITVPVTAGAQVVEIWFDSADYRLGKRVTIVSLVLTLLALVVPIIVRRRAHG